MVIKTPKETFVVTQSVPNLAVKNVVWGTKYIMYEGDVSIYCPSSGLCATLNMREEEGQVNAFSGKVEDEKSCVYELHGKIGRVGYYHVPGKPDEKQVLFDHSQIRVAKLTYLPRELQSPFESMRVWHSANEAIVNNDIVSADTHKKVVEAAQRVRQKQRHEEKKDRQGRFFVHADGPDGETDEEAEENALKATAVTRPLTVPSLQWQYRDNFSFDDASLQALKDEVAVEEVEVAKLAEQVPAVAGAEGEGCVIS